MEIGQLTQRMGRFSDGGVVEREHGSPIFPRIVYVLHASVKANSTHEHRVQCSHTSP